MNAFEEKNGVLHAEDVPLPTIAEKVGTPTYVYSSAHIRHQFEALQGAMAKALPANRQPLLCYAVKANSNLAILSFLRSLGASLEIVSEGELMRGLRAGFNANAIVSTGVGKTASEIAALLNAGVHQINVESLPELEHINRIATDMGKVAPVVFRLNPNVTGGGHEKISTGREQDKFGISKSTVFEGFAMAQEMGGINALGLSMHIGSQVFTVETFKEAFEKLPALVEELRAKGHTIERLDIGGGFPIQYDDENLLDLSAYAQWVNDIIIPLDTQIIMEPGRFLVGNAGVLLSRVEYMKESEGRKFLILDGAMNDLIRPTLYDAYHGMESVENRDAPTQSYDVVGPICETGDTFTTDRELPEMTRGDLMVIKSAGAYGFCMASNYNTRARPAEVLVHGDQFEIIRQRESVDEVLDKDIVPNWLS